MSPESSDRCGVTLVHSHNLQAGDRIDITWNQHNLATYFNGQYQQVWDAGSRRSMLVEAVSDQQIVLSGGFGNALPAWNIVASGEVIERTDGFCRIRFNSPPPHFSPTAPTGYNSYLSRRLLWNGGERRNCQCVGKSFEFEPKGCPYVGGLGSPFPSIGTRVNVYMEPRGYVLPRNPPLGSSVIPIDGSWKICRRSLSRGDVSGTIATGATTTDCTVVIDLGTDLIAGDSVSLWWGGVQVAASVTSVGTTLPQRVVVHSSNGNLPPANTAVMVLPMANEGNDYCLEATGARPEASFVASANPGEGFWIYAECDFFKLPLVSRTYRITFGGGKYWGEVYNTGTLPFSHYVDLRGPSGSLLGGVQMVSPYLLGRYYPLVIEGTTTQSQDTAQLRIGFLGLPENPSSLVLSDPIEVPKNAFSGGAMTIGGVASDNVLRFGAIQVRQRFAYGGV